MNWMDMQRRFGSSEPWIYEEERVAVATRSETVKEL